MNSEELKALRIPLAVLLVVIAAAGAAVYYTDLLAKQSGAALTRQKGEFQTAQSRMRMSGDEKNTIVQYVDKYLELEKSGFAGEEQRINWLDALRRGNPAAAISQMACLTSARSPAVARSRPPHPWWTSSTPGRPSSTAPTTRTCTR